MAISGASARVLVNGVAVGRVTGLTVNEDIVQAPVQELGEIDVIEHEPVERTVALTAEFVKVRLDSLGEQGIVPRGGTVEVLNFPEMVWQVYDRRDDIILATIDGVKPRGRSWAFRQGALVMTDANFVARRVFDEQES